MSPKEIVFLSTDKILGGGEFFLIELLPELVRRGWKVTLITPPHAPLSRDSALLNIVEIIPIDLSIKVRKWKIFLISMIAFLRLTSHRRDAIFYSNGFFGMKVLFLSTLLFHIKTVCHLHESDYSCYYNQRSKWQACFINQFFAISTVVKNEFIAGTGIAPEKVKLVHNGVPIDADSSGKVNQAHQERRLLNLPQDDLVVGMAARTNALKGHEVLLQAWASVCRQWRGGPITLIIAGLEQGQGEQAALYERIQRHLANASLANIHVLGAIPIEKVRNLMRLADLWVVPSTSEGFGRTAIEAMAEGTALVASDVGGLSDIVESGIDGVLVPPGNIDALTGAILELLNNDEERHRLAKAGQLKAKSQFSLHKMAHTIHKTLVNLKDQQAPASPH